MAKPRRVTAKRKNKAGAKKTRPKKAANKGKPKTGRQKSAANSNPKMLDRLRREAMAAIPLRPLGQGDAIAAEIVRRLRESFSPITLNLSNLTAQHAAHKEAKKSGGGHYALYMVSEMFMGVPRLARHQWVNSVLSDLLAKAVHALKLDLKDPTETKL